MSTKDTQRRDEISRQRGYGETTHRDEAENAGIAGETRAAPDRGMLRDDGQPKPSVEGDAALDRAGLPPVSPDDERHPNAPGTLNADKGAKKQQPQPEEANREIVDAYSKDTD